MTTTPEEDTPSGSQGEDVGSDPSLEEAIRLCFEPLAAKGLTKAVGFLDQTQLTLVGAAVAYKDDDTLERVAWRGLTATAGNINDRRWDGMFAIYTSDVRHQETGQPAGEGYFLDVKILRPMVGIQWEAIRMFYFEGEWTYTDMTSVEGFAPWASPQD